MKLYVHEIGFFIVDVGWGTHLKGYFCDFLQYFLQHFFTCRPSDATMAEDAGIEPRAVGSQTPKPLG
jgi:hypothetical protein